MSQKDVRHHLPALAAVLLCYAVAMLLFHSLAGGTLLSHQAWDSYSLQAENWLAGRNYIENGQNYSWLELAICNGRYYQSFPPVPVVVMLPWVLAFGSCDAVPSNLVILLFGLLCAAGVYACFWRRGASRATCAFFSVFVVMGSNLFSITSNGGVWFMAQTIGLCCAVWGIYFAICAGPGANVLTALLFCLALGCRPFYAVLALFWGICLLRNIFLKKAKARYLVWVSVPVILICGAMLCYNFVRFGSFFEFGHNFLPEYTDSPNDQFGIRYLLPNLLNYLRPVTLDSHLQLQFPIYDGFLPFVANPLFLLWAIFGFRAPFQRSRNPLAAQTRDRSFDALPGSGVACLLGFALVLIATAMHCTLGGWQFGARYTVDMMVWPLLWFLARKEGYRPQLGGITLCALAVLFNLYGAVYMLSQ